MIVSIDIGEKNFAYSIGVFQNDVLKITDFKHYNVVETKRVKDQDINISCNKITDILNSDPNISFCSTVLIEEQFHGVKKGSVISNNRAIRISHHLWTYFQVKHNPSILRFVKSSLKTQYYLGKNKLTANQRKKWAVDMIIGNNSILKQSIHCTDHSKIIENIKQYTKKDDICDTILQMHAFHEVVLTPLTNT